MAIDGSQSVDAAEGIVPSEPALHEEEISTMTDVAAVEKHVQSVTAHMSSQTVKLDDLLDLAISKGVSDIHLMSESKISLRLYGVLVDVDSIDTVTTEQVTEMIRSMVSEDEFAALTGKKELDFGYQHDNGTMVRGNAYYQQSHLGCVLRIIPKVIKTVSELGLPSILSDFAAMKSGLVIFTGPTGSGKTTSMASLLEEMNRTQNRHIITIEDPIEYVFTPDKCIFSQRELGVDTLSYEKALRSAFREDPDVLVITELRGMEEIDTVLTLAETGHLVFATLHTWNAPGAISRIVSSFPAEQQEQVLHRLSESLSGVITQRLLINVADGGLVPACEVLINTDSMSSTIRNGMLTQVDSVMQTAAGDGMITMQSSLESLLTDGKISELDARSLLPHDGFVPVSDIGESEEYPG